MAEPVVRLLASVGDNELATDNFDGSRRTRPEFRLPKQQLHGTKHPLRDTVGRGLPLD
jgi:hypothetical protein